MPVSEAQAAWRASPEGREARREQGRRRRERLGIPPRLCPDCSAPLQYHKKLCDTCRERRKAARRAAGRPKTVSDYSLSQYGLSDADYARMLSEQGGLCAICERPLRRGNGKPQIDHDHRCCSGERIRCGGKCVRGIVHGRCNRGIAQLGDDPVVYAAAARFVAFHNERLGFGPDLRESGPIRRRTPVAAGLFDAPH